MRGYDPSRRPCSLKMPLQRFVRRAVVLRCDQKHGPHALQLEHTLRNRPVLHKGDVPFVWWRLVLRRDIWLLVA